MAARRRRDPDYNLERYQVKAHRDLLKASPTFWDDLDAFVTAEYQAWANDNDAVLTERRTGNIREITADPRKLVERKAKAAERQEELAEARRRLREALDRASHALATPGD
jgi:hypothetical protein